MEPYVGQISMFGGNFAPRGWQMCNGQLLAISQWSALFSILGTTYGGDGVTTFALPNLQSRIPIHWGSGPGLSPYAIGEITGSESVTLTSQQMPMHNHLVNANSQAATQSTPGTFLLALSNDPAASTVINTYTDAAADSTMNPAMIMPAGGSQPHNNIQPVLAITFIIALEGVYPSRN
ncbi:MAG: tail fiber protein [Bacteroidota bacterium]